MHQVYREFSRQKYNKYKHQFPKMRESDIISKIIREWDSLGPQGKAKLHQHYENNKFIGKDEQLEMDIISRCAQKTKKEKHHLEKTEDKPSTIKSQIKEQGHNANEFEAYAHSQVGESKRSIDSANLMTPQTNGTKRNSNKNNYIHFYKYNYCQLQKQHPRWAPTQLTKMISLMWAKRKKQYKLGSIKKETHKRTKLTKPVDGRRLFRKTKRLDADQVKQQWNHLPMQSRTLWTYPGKEIPKPLNQMLGKMILKSNPGHQLGGGVFSFLNKVME